VNVISKPGLLKLSRHHPVTLPALVAWYKATKRAEWRGLHEVRRVFPSVDQVGNVLIFNIMGGS
jgi:mRNA interferase HigB